jgi:hypothetical protein
VNTKRPVKLVFPIEMQQYGLMGRELKLVKSYRSAICGYLLVGVIADFVAIPVAPPRVKTRGN